MIGGGVIYAENIQVSTTPQHVRHNDHLSKASAAKPQAFKSLSHLLPGDLMAKVELGILCAKHEAAWVGLRSPSKLFSKCFQHHGSPEALFWRGSIAPNCLPREVQPYLDTNLLLEAKEQMGASRLCWKMLEPSEKIWSNSFAVCASASHIRVKSAGAAAFDLREVFW